MGIFGVDVSNHQTSFDFTGWDFAFLKASEGADFRDRMFHTHLANARKAGAIVAAYHYQREGDAKSQIGNIESMVPKDVPVIIDVENKSGSPQLTREIIAGLRKRGYRIGPLYLPKWYWDRIGKPSLHDLPTLWASWYPDYVARPRESGIAKVPASAWNAYGGRPVSVMQFTSTPFDQNYFNGTRADLRLLLEDGDDMTPDELLDTQIEVYRSDATVEKKETIRNILGWSDAQHKNTRENEAATRTSIQELKWLVEELGRKVDNISNAGNADAVAELAKQKVVDDLND